MIKKDILIIKSLGRYEMGFQGIQIVHLFTFLEFDIFIMHLKEC